VDGEAKTALKHLCFQLKRRVLSFRKPAKTVRGTRFHPSAFSLGECSPELKTLTLFWPKYMYVIFHFRPSLKIFGVFRSKWQKSISGETKPQKPKGSENPSYPMSDQNGSKLYHFKVQHHYTTSPSWSPYICWLLLSWENFCRAHYSRTFGEQFRLNSRWLLPNNELTQESMVRRNLMLATIRSIPRDDMLLLGLKVLWAHLTILLFIIQYVFWWAPGMSSPSPRTKPTDPELCITWRLGVKRGPPEGKCFVI